MLTNFISPYGNQNNDLSKYNNKKQNVNIAQYMLDITQLTDVPISDISRSSSCKMAATLPVRAVEGTLCLASSKVVATVQTESYASRSGTEDREGLVGNSVTSNI